MKIFSLVRRKAVNLYRREILKDGPLLEAKRFFRDNGDTNRRLTYDLDRESVVVDIGGYIGDFAHEIYARYGSTVHVFEPVPKFYGRCVDRFRGNPKIIPHCFGLGSTSGRFNISEDDDASSFIVPSTSKTLTAEMRAIVPTLPELGISEIDLLKINVEGGEYDILPTLIDAGWMPRIRDLQVQFHTVGDYESARESIRIELARTHYETWCYKFVWENWRRRST